MVSVIIPVFNAAGHLAACINSILSQTWVPLEIIIVDDGSTDNSLAIANAFQVGNVRIIAQRNKGASAARNAGLKLAGGRYIQFLDADDLLSPDKIESQMTALALRQDVIAVCSTIHFPDGEPHEHHVPSAYEERFLNDTGDPVVFLTRLLGGYDFQASMIQPGAWLSPIDLIKNAGWWDETLSLDDDGEFFSRTILASTGIIRTQGAVFYRKYKNSRKNLSSQGNYKALDSLYRSTILKARHLYARRKNEFTERAVYKQLIELQIKCYLVEPGLYRSISAKLKQFPDWGFRPPMGGKFINTISVYLGWKVAKRLQLLYKLFR